MLTRNKPEEVRWCCKLKKKKIGQPGKHYFDQVIKVNMTSDHSHCHDIIASDNVTSEMFSPNPEPQTHHEENMKSNVCDILQNAWQAFFKTSKSWKARKQWDIVPDGEDYGNTMTKHNEISYPGWDLGKEKGHLWKDRCNSNKVSNSVNNIMSMWVP